MTEKELIQQIKNLKQIKPNHDWVVLAKQEIIDSAPTPNFTETIFQTLRKPSMVLAPVFVLLMGLFVSAQNAVPGDALFIFKRAVEKGNAIFLVSDDHKNEYNLYLANKRLEELSKISTKNEIKRLKSALEELKNAKREVQNEFAKQVKARPQEEAVEIARVTAESLAEIEEKEVIYMETLGVKSESSEESSNKIIAEFMFAVISEKELNDEDNQLLDEAKEHYQNGEYSQSLRKLWQIGGDYFQDDNQEQNDNNKDKIIQSEEFQNK